MKEHPVKVYKREALYIRTDGLNQSILDAFETRYTHRFFDEKACSSCDKVGERFSEEFCTPCSAYKGTTLLTGQYTLGGKEYTKVPLGDARSAIAFLRSHGITPDVVNCHPEGRRYPFKFIGKWRSEAQKEAHDGMIKMKRGVLKAPARTGKTVISTAVICTIGKKTLILASQREWLLGFYNTFVGSKTQEALTNIPKDRIGFCKTLDDFKKYVVCIATYQTFINNPKLLRAIRDLFPVVVVDEVHRAASKHFLRVVGNLNAEYFFGLSGTPGRKDGKYKLVALVLGPVGHKMEADYLRPRWSIIKTKYVGTGKGGWSNIVKRLEMDKERQKLIAQWAIRDAKAGHVILIPFAQTDPILNLVKLINEEAGEKLAYCLHGKMRRKERDDLIAAAQAGEIPILVGTVKLLDTGTNIPPASCLYEVTLSSNIYNAEQRIARILTPYDNKLPPVVRVFCDEYKVRKACLKNEWTGVIEKRFNPIISDKMYQAWMNYLNDRRGVNTSGRAILGW